MLRGLAAIASLTLGAALGGTGANAQVPLPAQPPCRANENGRHCFERMLADKGHKLHSKFLLSRQAWCRFYGIAGPTGPEQASAYFGRLCQPAGIDMYSHEVRLDAGASEEQRAAEFAKRASLARAADMDLLRALGCKVEPSGVNTLTPPMSLGTSICWDLNYQIEVYDQFLKYAQ
jgi:hypothetical protein